MLHSFKDWCGHTIISAVETTPFFFISNTSSPSPAPRITHPTLPYPTLPYPTPPADYWVARDVDGRRLHKYAPYVTHPLTSARMRQGLPFPAHCCWNGLVSMTASPFLSGLRFRSASPTSGECQAPLHPHPNLTLELNITLHRW
jgi:hypothetical protein